MAQGWEASECSWTDARANHVWSIHALNKEGLTLATAGMDRGEGM